MGVNDLHRTSAEHITRPDDHRKANLLRHGKGVFGAFGDSTAGALQIQLVEQLFEALTVLGTVDRVGGSSQYRNACAGEGNRELERGLAAELHDDAVRLLHLHDFHHVLERQRFEIELVGRVVVGGNGFRIAVHHDRLETDLLEGERSMHTAVVELDALTDSVRAAPENHDLLLVVPAAHFALQTPCGIHVGRQRGKLGSARIDATVHRLDSVSGARRADLLRTHCPKRSDLAITETHLFGLPQELGWQRPTGRFTENLLECDDLPHLLQEPRIDVRGLVDLLDGETDPQTVCNVPEPVSQRSSDQVQNRLAQRLGAGLRQIGQHRLGGVDAFACFDEPAHLRTEVSVVHLVEQGRQPVATGFQ